MYQKQDIRNESRITSEKLEEGTGISRLPRWRVARSIFAQEKNKEGSEVDKCGTL